MERHQNSTPGSSQGTAILDVKPLRTLAPMFPPSLGFTVQSSPTTPFVSISPFGSSDTQSTQPSDFSKASKANGSMTDHFASHILRTPPPMVVPLNEYSALCQDSRRKRRVSSDPGTDKSKKKKLPRKKYPKVQDALILPSSSDPRETVEVILLTYDALRRRLLQLDEANNLNKSAHLKAGTIMMDNDLRINTNKKIGPLEGIEIGDIFYFRFEMCLIGLHVQSMAGIDYVNTKINDENDTLAISIVSSGGYENESEDTDVLIYSGQGGNKVNDKKTQVDDQKLERGNLALERSLHRSNLIRVTRATKDNNVLNGKIYYYDGLYKIQESWIEKGKTGFNVFKYKLTREPGQPDGFAIWKLIEKWKQNPSSRDGVILPDISSGEESIPVCLVNEVDMERGPELFSYSGKVSHVKPISFLPPLQGCACLNVCLPGDSNCLCAQSNGGDSPYSANGVLVRRRPLVYECGSSCRCSVNCRNRVVQKGIKLCFEVFRTLDRGWGLRSWDPIRAGTYICEYAGEIVDTNEIGQHGEDCDFIFDPNAGDATFKWNYGPELLGESSPEESPKSLPFVISARRTGNMARFINHSCFPNLFWQPVLHDHGNEDYPHVAFFAIKHIPPMTELTYDYGHSGKRSKHCLCGLQKCRGFFG